MRLGDHLSEDFIDKLYRKVFSGMKNKSNHITSDSYKGTEHMMGRFKKTLHRGKGGAWK